MVQLHRRDVKDWGRGSIYYCGMMAGGRQLSKAVRPIAQRGIPAYAGMTWVGAGMAWVGAGMTWVGAGMT